MTTAESQIKLMYATSDADLARIASYLFGCSASMTPALVDQIQMDASIMNTMNKTVFGDSSILPASPGLLRDIISIGDGVSQLDEVGKGQAQSVRAASTAQVTAAKSMKATIIDDSQKISDLIVQNINYLIGNRTFVQNKGFNDLTTNIEEVSNQVGNDADDIVNRFSEKYTDLSTRYEDWKMLSTAAIEDTNTKLTDIKGRVTNLLNQIASTESQFEAQANANVRAQLATVVQQFTDAMTTAQSGININLQNAAGTLADQIDQSHDEFYHDQVADQNAIDSDIQTLSDSVSADATLNDNNDKTFIQQADSSLQNLANTILSCKDWD